MILKVDTSINEKTVSILKESIEAINSGVKSGLDSDFSALTSLGLFSSQLDSLKQAVDRLITYHENFAAVVEENKYQWGEVANQVQNDLNNIDGPAATNPPVTQGPRVSSPRYSGPRSSSPTPTKPGDNLGDVNPGKSVKTEDVTNVINKLDADTLKILLKKLYLMSGKKSLVDLFVDDAKSGELLVYLKKILGDTTDNLSDTRTTDSDTIQKLLLTKINKDKVDVTTDEGKTKLDKVILDSINTAPPDESKWNTMIYGDNTHQVSVLDGNWVVAKTVTDLNQYASYVSSARVSQDSDTSKYSDYCLAFAYVHAYDLYNGTKSSASDAGNYAHAGAFYDYIDDDKSKVLAKVYDEIMNGRPVVIQVNGNKAGTSRHFVTVVGFREGVTSADTLTEKDLLIIDSWDGKVERMDTATSRFMTSGADCHKDYSGYRLRLLKV